MTLAPPALDGVGWSATYESHDQRGGDVYYVVTLVDGTHFMARLDVERYGDDWTGPDFVSGLRADLAEVAATRTTNTTYAPWPPLT